MASIFSRFKLGSTSRNADDPDKKDRGLVFYITFVLVTFGLAALGMFTICRKCDCWRALGAGALLASGSFVTGAFLGLLFGIPRGPAQGEHAPPNPKILGTNTNLIQISDWLTKALVGVSLTQFYKIPNMLMKVGNYYEKDVGSGPVAIAVLIHFLVSGFLSGYLLTRVILQQAFHRADQVPEEGKKLPTASIEPAEDPSPPKNDKDESPPVAKGAS